MPPERSSVLLLKHLEVLFAPPLHGVDYGQQGASRFCDAVFRPRWQFGEDSFCHEAVKYYYHALLRYKPQRNLCRRCNENGDIEGHPALKEAYNLGTQL